MTTPRSVLAVLLGCCALLIFTAPASAITYTVDTLTDGADDGECVTDCTLREAIVLADQFNNMDQIHFSVAGTINAVAPMPVITGAASNGQIDIDGTTAPGASAGDPTVEVDGSAAGAGADGFTLWIGGTIRSLAINNFSGSGIEFGGNGTGNMVVGSYIGLDLDGFTPQPNGIGVSFENAFNSFVGNGGVSGRNVISGNTSAGVSIGTSTNGISIRGNYIGTNAVGMATVPNGGHGIVQAGGGSSFIGGDFAGAENLISGNSGSGIAVGGGSSVEIKGNLIGTNATGTAALPNGNSGVHLHTAASGVVVGGTTAEARNVISGNTVEGILIDGVSGNAVNGNLIGTDITGFAPLANNGAGVRIVNGSNNLIGDLSPNVIAFNQGPAGISLAGSGSGNLLSAGNSVHSNNGLGVDLGGDGVTANDPAPDADTGPNGLLNFPVINTAASTPTTTTVTGTISAVPNTSYFIDIYSNDSCDPSGFGEAKSPRGGLFLTTDATGNAPFVFSASSPVPAGEDSITAAAIDVADNSSSELSPCVSLTRGPDPPPPGPAPSNGDTVLAQPAGGVVKVKVPGSDRFVVLRAGDAIPVGSHVDAGKGRVRLTSVSPQEVRQTADFYAGRFQVLQRDGAALVTLALEGANFRNCSGRRGGRSSKAFGPRRVLRKLWGSGRGRFRTRGRGGAGTVRGTKWLTADRCDGTLFKVREGVVAVRDFDRRKTVEVKAGGRYLARLR